ncbi:MAG TPA: protein phosphatase 2C domain-containing protein [Chthoniobacterales bacterium]
MSSFVSSRVPQELRWSGQTDRGKVRQNNEDTFLGLALDAREAHYLGKVGSATTAEVDLVFAVSDGMGGSHSGEFASRITLDKIGQLIVPSFKHSAMGLSTPFADIFTQLFNEIHRALSYLGGSYEECAGMGATLSICWFTPGWMYYGHVGDSRIYYLPAQEKGKIQQITEDDTHVGWLLRNGKISEHEARVHPRRTVLQKALGGGHHYVDPQIGAVACESGDIFLLCTDGIVDGLYNDRILQLLRTPDINEAALDPARRLIAASLQSAARDNMTAMVVEVG